MAEKETQLEKIKRISKKYLQANHATLWQKTWVRRHQVLAHIVIVLPFALLGGVGVALITGPIGCFILWRRMVVFGAALSHSALLGVVLGLGLGIGVTPGALLVCVAVALAFVALSRDTRVSADAVLNIVAHAALALGFKPEPFVEAFPDGMCAGVRLRYAVEPAPLDTAGAIRFAADASGIDDTFVVANGDVLTDLDVSSLVAFHRANGAEATLHLIAVPDPSVFGVVALGADGRVERFVEKPAPGTEPSNLVNAGTYVLEPSVLARIPVAEKTSIERATFPAVVADGGLGVRVVAMPRLEIVPGRDAARLKFHGKT